MPTDVVMPQMGESIFEGTITKWLKKPGDNVQRDEPLFEISTDKVDAEIPAPTSGILKEIKIDAGATVQVNTVVATIDAEGTAAAVGASAQPAPTVAQSAPQSVQQPSHAAVAVSVPAASSNGGPAVDVVMPQMGESIFEGTITKWLKKVGDNVQRDEPLFEISTDKVDAEIPAPTSGVLREIKAAAGTTVQVSTVVAVIGGAGSGGAGVGGAAVVGASAPAAPTQPPAPQPVSVVAAKPQPEVMAFLPVDRGNGGQHLRSSPLVRRIARENAIDLTNVPATGLGGRITKTDILGFVERHKHAGPVAVQSAAIQPAGTQPAGTQKDKQPAPLAIGRIEPKPSAPPVALTGELVPMTPMRGKIAERMVESLHVSAHVHTVFKVDMTRIVKFREKTRKQWEARNGVKLTFMPFIAKALMNGIRVKPVINSSVVGNAIQYHKNINVGIAVAVEWGLIVPVVKQAENLSFVGLQRAIADVGERARNKKLVPDDVQGGTITITNPGIYGPQFGMPIILQPQVAILGMGGVFKEPVVITDEDGNDSIAVRHIIRLVLGYDHRIIDGADADQFMVAVREYLENFSDDIG